MKKVAVIGAGAAGLCTLRHALPLGLQAVAFEKTRRIGGTWVYTEDADDNGDIIHSSMYKNLRTNIPKEVMNFPDFPFKEHLPSFLPHEYVLEYLEAYAEEFSLLQHIKFNTTVKDVQPILREGHDLMPKWKVEYASNDDLMDTKTEIFDGVFVCSGHYSNPQIPDIPGLGDFEGPVLHSHSYRTPEQFAGQRVFVLGAAASGQDICVDMSGVAKQVLLSHNKNLLQTELPVNVKQVPGVKQFLKGGALLLNGEEVEFDQVLLCTGYTFNFPFLSPECQVTIVDHRIMPLYKHLVHTTFPNLYFIGMCKIICPFPQFHVQIQFCLKILTDALTLPSKEEMDKDTKDDYDKRMAQGLPHRHAHLMGPRQWTYNKEICDLAGLEPIPPSVQKLYDHVHAIRVKKLLTYKQTNFKLTGGDSFETIKYSN